MDDAVILLAGVGLARDELALFESSSARELSVELLDPRGIAAEEEQERRLGAGGPLGAEKSEIGADTADLLQVQKQVRGPERGALSDGRRLRRLEVRVGQGGKIPMRQGEVAQDSENGNEPSFHEAERFAHLNQVPVVGDVRGRRAPVDDA